MSSKEESSPYGSEDELDVFDMMNEEKMMEGMEVDLGDSTDEEEEERKRKEERKAKKKAAKKARKLKFKKIEKKREKMRKARMESIIKRKRQKNGNEDENNNVNFVLVTKKKAKDDATNCRRDDPESDSSVSSVSSVSTDDSSSDDGIRRFMGGGMRFFGFRRKPLPPWEPAENLEEQRKRYACGPRYVTLETIPSIEKDTEFEHRHPEPLHGVDAAMNKKIALYRGNITTLELDAVVNAANASLIGGGGIDGAIRDAAGPHIDEATGKLGGCPEGQTKKTLGYNLPAKYVLHTVGPMMERPKVLRSSYDSVLSLVASNEDIRTVGLCCVSTGIFGYPLRNATHIALTAVREWLPNHMKDVDRIVFVVFTPQEFAVYKQCIPKYFPKFDVTSTDAPVLEESKEPPRRRFWGRFHSPSSSDDDDNEEDDDMKEYRRFQRKQGYRMNVPSFTNSDSSSSPPPPPPRALWTNGIPPPPPPPPSSHHY